MLKYNKKETDKLSDQFEINEDNFEDAARLWSKVQDKINEKIESSIRAEDDGVAFDARDGMEIFFKHFNTQELQNIALIQFIMRDLQDRAKTIIYGDSKGKIKELLSKLMKERFGDNGEDKDNKDSFDDVL
jgi:hypothetical protein